MSIVIEALGVDESPKGVYCGESSPFMDHSIFTNLMRTIYLSHECTLLLHCMLITVAEVGVTGFLVEAGGRNLIGCKVLESRDLIHFVDFSTPVSRF